MDAKETSFYTAVLIISIVLGVIIAYFIISIIRQQRRSVALYRKSILTEIITLEKERKRIASDLHDEMGPMLSALKLQVSSFELTDEADREVARKTGEHIDGLVQQMREVAFDLMPRTLLKKGPAYAIQEFVDYCSINSSGLSINFRFEEGMVFNEQQAINLYRIAKEIIHNTIKHAKASELRMELRKDKNTIVLASSDNGIGYDHDNRLNDSGGYGLQNLLSRTEIMGGRMYVTSKRGKGTTYIFEIPFSHE